ncbi:extracellular solute-binding protein [Streptomyces sp. CB03911]|uniref:extracellular solute-binding protein n=1 Tax=Streptomyces sp. CB03911 TaxID=1804758 RepID=UPI00093E366F|nr:extracellular solute-binding protein [Streptomyces sp. CB03911]OKI30018.1 hypothetical protein A6A07_22065 [Streptomyces sp. CB03911]
MRNRTRGWAGRRDTGRARGRTGRRPGALAVALLLAGMAGCTGGDTPGPLYGTDGTGCPDGPPSVIRLATGSDLSGSGVRGRLVEEWNRRCPGHPVRVVELSADADLQRSQMVAAEQSGGARYDVLNLDVTWTAEFAEAGLIRELPWTDDGDFLDSARRTVEFDHRVWGRPFNTDAGLLYYRLDLLRAARTPDSGPDGRGPADWPALKRDVEQVDAALDRAVHTAYQAGYITQLGDYEGLTVNALEAIWGAGGELAGADGTVVDGSLQVRAQSGLDALAARYHDRRMMPASARSADETESLRAFAAGEVVFMRNWPYAYGVLAQTLAPGRDFEVTTLPARDPGGAPGVSVLGGQNLAVTTESAHPEAAAALIGFLTGRESERCLLEGGLAATRDSAYAGGPGAPRCPLAAASSAAPSSAATPSAGPSAAPPGGAPSAEPEGRADAVRGADGLPRYAQTLRRALGSARPRPATPYYEAFTHEVQAQVGRMLEPAGGPLPTADDLNGRLAAVLRGGN